MSAGAATASRVEQPDADNHATNTLPLPPSYDRVGKAFLKIMVTLWACAMLWWAYSAFFSGRVTPAFDVHVQGITFHKMVNQRQLVSVPRDITCYGDHQIVVTAYVHTIGVLPANTGASKDAPVVRIKAEPVGGSPAEAVEYQVRLMTRNGTRYNPSTGHRVQHSVTVDIPPSFAGRDINWTATAWHPNDRQTDNNQVADVTLPACKA